MEIRLGPWDLSLLPLSVVRNQKKPIVVIKLHQQPCSSSSKTADRHGGGGARVERGKVRVCASVVVVISTKRIPAMTTTARLVCGGIILAAGWIEKRQETQKRGKGEKQVTKNKSKNSRI